MTGSGEGGAVGDAQGRFDTSFCKDSSSKSSLGLAAS